QHAVEGANERPDERPQQDGQSDDHQKQDNPDHEIQDADPEGPDLKLVVCAQKRVGRADLHVGDDDADQAGDSDDIGDQIENVDDQRELLVGNGRLQGLIGSGG